MKVYPFCILNFSKQDSLITRRVSFIFSDFSESVKRITNRNLRDYDKRNRNKSTQAIKFIYLYLAESFSSSNAMSLNNYVTIKIFFYQYIMFVHPSSLVKF